MIIIGSTSTLCKELLQYDKSSIVIGRKNHYNAINYIQGRDLSSDDGIESVKKIINSILKESKEQNHSLVFLNGISEKNFKKSFYVNLYSTALISETFAQCIQKNGAKGNLVYVSSLAVKKGGKIEYASTKAGLEGLMNSIISNYSPNIRANIVLPGAFHSGMIADWNKEKINRITESLSMKRLANSSEVAHAIKFLTENNYINGAILNLNLY